eukprot:1161345-Pelagomonas_calceolata.AAC.23
MPRARASASGEYAATPPSSAAAADNKVDSAACICCACNGKWAFEPPAAPSPPYTAANIASALRWGGRLMALNGGSAAIWVDPPGWLSLVNAPCAACEVLFFY